MVDPSTLSQQTAPGSSPGAPPGQELMPLRAMFGQDEVNYGTARYAVGGDGLVWVPPEAIGALIAVGGFARAYSGHAVNTAGTVRLRRDDAIGCCYGGRQYTADANGDVLVPAEAAAELLAHGFVPVTAEASSDLRGAKPSSSTRGRKGLSGGFW